MRLSLDLGLGSIATMGGGGAAQPLVRIEPGDADLFYAVFRDGSAGKVVRWERDLFFPADSTNLGVQSPAFRPTGLGTLTAFRDVAATETEWQTDENGAMDFVARTAGGVFMFSAHGIGAAGSLDAEAMLIDGEAFDHTVETEGDTFELSNTVTASDGTNSGTREIIWTLNEGATLKGRMESVSTTGLNLHYLWMPMGTGLGFDEIAYRRATDWNVEPMGSAEALATLADADGVRLRNPTSGAYVTAASDLSARTGFVQCRVDKEQSNEREKGYLGQFSSAADLAGSEVVFEWGVGSAGAGTPATNLLANANWDAPPWVRTHTTGGTIVDGGTDLTMTWSSGTSNLRTNAEIQTSLIGSRYALSVDLASLTGTGVRELYIGINANGSSTSPAYTTTTAIVGRNIAVYTATQDAPNQRFALRNASTVAFATVWRNPAVRAVA